MSLSAVEWMSDPLMDSDVAEASFERIPPQKDSGVSLEYLDSADDMDGEAVPLCEHECDRRLCYFERE